MKKNLLNKKIPTALGLIFLIAAIGAAIFFINKKNLSHLGKTEDFQPEKIHIANIADTQFTVSWITKKKTTGAVKYGKDIKIKTLIADDRDQLSGGKGKFLTHYATIKNLSPSTTYYFKIVSGGKLYDNKGQPYKITLGPTIGSVGEAKIINGKVLDQNKLPVQGAIVYLTVADAVPASSLTDKDGRWVIYLNKVRTANLTAYVNLDPEAAILKINAEAGKNSASAITTTKNAFPVPDIILGQGPFDFREKSLTAKKPLPIKTSAQSEEKKAAKKSAEKKEDIPSQFNTEPLASTNYAQVAITNPQEDGEEINTDKPEFQGTGPANAILTIKIKSSLPQTATVAVDENGNWSYTPVNNLTPGSYTIYVSYVDKNGDTQEISKNFVILAAKTSDLPSLTSTPSAAISPSPSPIARTTIPSTSSGVPKTGIIGPTFIVFMAGLILIVFGIIFIKFDNNNKILS